jgi:lipopolysaccharide transport protein LptA
MNFALRPTLLPLCFLLACGVTVAQTATDTTNPDTPPAPGATVITSDELHSDENAHTSIFTGTVTVDGTNFKMTCQEMTVLFTKDNKVDEIVATGNVIINQPDRVTHCGRAHYFREDDRFVLTEAPVIVDHKDTIAAPQITIFRTSQKLITSGGPSKVILPGGMDSPKTPAASASTDSKLP